MKRLEYKSAYATPAAKVWCDTPESTEAFLNQLETTQMSRNSKMRRQKALKLANRASKPGPKQTTPKHGKKNTWYNKLKGTAPVGPSKPSKQSEETEE